MYYKFIITNSDAILINSIISKISKFYITITINVNFFIIYAIVNNKNKLSKLSLLNKTIFISTAYNKIIYKIFYLYLTQNHNHSIFIDYSFYDLNNITIHNSLSIKTYLQLTKFNNQIYNVLIKFYNNTSISNRIFYLTKLNFKHLVFLKNYLKYFCNIITNLSDINNIYSNSINKCAYLPHIIFINNNRFTKAQIYTKFYNKLLLINVNMLVLSLP